MITCRTCEQTMPDEKFHRDASKANGRRGVCKICDRQRCIRWQGENMEHMRGYRKVWRNLNPQRVKDAIKKTRARHRASWIVKAAKRRAIKKNIPFDLIPHIEEIQKVIDAGMCQMTGLPFDLEAKREWNSPSLHRINPKKGYVWGNVLVICHGMNCALGTWGEDRLREIMTAWMNRS